MIPLGMILGPGLVGLVAWWWASQRWTRNEPPVIAAAAAAVTLVLMLAGWGWWQGRQLEAAQARARADALVRDSLEAELDTLEVHVVATDSARRVAERRAIQVDLELDAVEQQLGITEARLRARVRAEVAALDTTAAAAVTDSAGVRFARWDLREPPYTIDAAVAMPAPPDSGRISLGIRLDPVDLHVRIGCQEIPGRDVRAVRLSVEGPDWLRIQGLDGQTDPDVCNPYIVPIPDPPAQWPTWALMAGGAVIGGLVTDPLPGMAIGAGLGLTVDIGRRGVLSLLESF